MFHLLYYIFQDTHKMAWVWAGPLATQLPFSKQFPFMLKVKSFFGEKSIFILTDNNY